MSGEVSPSSEIAEVQGLYGPIRVSELLIQKLWYRREFAFHGLRTIHGAAFHLIHPGRWNRLGGPDFLGGEWEIDGRRVLGDIEIHFYERDWKAHGHETNPAFSGVRLHVLVFDPGTPTLLRKNGRGEPVETLVLGPYLRESLEEYAWREAMRTLEGCDPLDLAAPLLKEPMAGRRASLHAGARARWAHKVAWARRRLDSHGWEESCHQVALEVLGYQANRVPMADLALRQPLAAWRTLPLEGIEAFLRDPAYAWKTNGMRPANFPRQRLSQYQRIMRHAPRWPETFRQLAKEWRSSGEPLESTAAFRRRNLLSRSRKEVREVLFGEVLASPRLDTVLIDGLLPLLAAECGEERWFPFWWHWYPGDLPDSLRLFLRVLGTIDREQPLGNGAQQGALATLSAREQSRLTTEDLEPA
jgi:hypothetical protein